MYKILLIVCLFLGFHLKLYNKRLEIGTKYIKTQAGGKCVPKNNNFIFVLRGTWKLFSFCHHKKYLSLFLSVHIDGDYDDDEDHEDDEE